MSAEQAILELLATANTRDARIDVRDFIERQRARENKLDESLCRLRRLEQVQRLLDENRNGL